MNKITLSKPIKMGDKEITEIDIREPTAGELRGVKISDIVQVDVAAFELLLPRITNPALSSSHVSQLSLKDFAKFSRQVVGFFADSLEDSPIV